MLDAFFGGNAAWFGVPALIGTGIFVVRMVLMMVGHHGGMDMDGTDTDVHHGDDPGAAFKVLSFQSIMAFAMGFGWAGLGALNGLHKDVWVSSLFGVGGGVAMTWLLFILLKAVYGLQSSGNVNIAQAVGREADVYVSIPAKGQGRGQVRVVLDERQRIYNAESDGEALPSQSRVRVVKINDDNSVTVVPA